MQLLLTIISIQEVVHLFLNLVIDSTDIQLRHSVANLVASALGTSCTSKMRSHLWLLIFAPEALQGTYLAGYMVRY